MTQGNVELARLASSAAGWGTLALSLVAIVTETDSPVTAAVVLGACVVWSQAVRGPRIEYFRLGVSIAVIVGLVWAVFLLAVPPLATGTPLWRLPAWSPASGVTFGGAVDMNGVLIMLTGGLRAASLVLIAALVIQTVSPWSIAALTRRIFGPRWGRSLDPAVAWVASPGRDGDHRLDMSSRSWRAIHQIDDAFHVVESPLIAGIRSVVIVAGFLAGPLLILGGITIPGVGPVTLTGACLIATAAVASALPVAVDAVPAVLLKRGLVPLACGIATLLIWALRDLLTSFEVIEWAALPALLFPLVVLLVRPSSVEVAR